ncbi:hypothetical protein OSB04_024307 [Centaurea solstitialis]|uniref:Uncharacterized protein n=1 Tax=Centaurea solstitialis TaxID=347529 RepID=A0AA38SY68_9ASTR|nr:hypothetical protein OSB04_024307 [Centaurea solstitialis]
MENRGVFDVKPLTTAEKRRKPIRPPPSDLHCSRRSTATTIAGAPPPPPSSALHRRPPLPRDLQSFFISIIRSLPQETHYRRRPPLPSPASTTIVYQIWFIMFLKAEVDDHVKIHLMNLNNLSLAQEIQPPIMSPVSSPALHYTFNLPPCNPYPRPNQAPSPIFGNNGRSTATSGGGYTRKRWGLLQNLVYRWNSCRRHRITRVDLEKNKKDGGVQEFVDSKSMFRLGAITKSQISAIVASKKTKKLNEDLEGIDTNAFETDSEWDKTITKWTEKFSNLSIRPNEIVKKVTESDKDDWNFKLNFIILSVNTMVETMKMGTCTTTIFPHLPKDLDFKNVNWCKFIYDSAKNNKLNNKQIYFFS